MSLAQPMNLSLRRSLWGPGLLSYWPGGAVTPPPIPDPGNVVTILGVPLTVLGVAVTVTAAVVPGAQPLTVLGNAVTVLAQPLTVTP